MYAESHVVVYGNSMFAHATHVPDGDGDDGGDRVCHRIPPPFCSKRAVVWGSVCCRASIPRESVSADTHRHVYLETSAEDGSLIAGARPSV